MIDDCPCFRVAREPHTAPGGAREAVARALGVDCGMAEDGYSLGDLLATADVVFAALRPIIAAEIRAWAEGVKAPGGEVHWLVEELGVPETASGVVMALNSLTQAADAIASRICGVQENK